MNDKVMSKKHCEECMRENDPTELGFHGASIVTAYKAYLGEITYKNNLKRKLFHQNKGLFCPFCTSEDYHQFDGEVPRYLREYKSAYKSGSKFHNYDGNRVTRMLNHCETCGNFSYVYYELKSDPFFVEKATEFEQDLSGGGFEPPRNSNPGSQEANRRKP